MNPEYAQHLSCLILESPFSAVNKIIAKFAWNLPGSESVLPYLVSSFKFREYKAGGIAPNDYVAQLPKDLPVLFVHSKRDRLIDINHSRSMYIKMREAGHKNVYLVELSSGQHANILWDLYGRISRDGQKYYDAVQALYKKVGLPYDAPAAGRINLADYQPTEQEVRRRMGK